VIGPGVRHWLEYALFTSIRWKVRFLPERLALEWGYAFGWFLGSVLGIRRHVTEENLNRAFPDEHVWWRRKVANASYGHMGREAVATLKMSWMNPEEIVRRTPIQGWEAFQEALAEGRGVILATGHLGNWEVGAACLAARGVPVDGVTKAMSNTRFGGELAEVRRRLGYREVDVSQAPRAIPRSLKEGRMVALLGDQNIRRGGVFVPFFGTPAATARGVALFALKTGAPIFLGVAVREPGWPQRYQGILEPIPVKDTGDLEADVRRVTARYTAALERLVRQYPEQYFWQHKRWATRPSHGEDSEPAPEGSV
jgi:KDO2-lipid IV(A) lauroyltransferase